MNEEAEILLVEDDPADAEMTIWALRTHKINNGLLHLKDGEEALNYIYAKGEYSGRSVNNFPRLILLDLKMPKINGLEVLEQLKSDPRTNRIPVIVLTSSKEDPDVQLCYKLGVNSYIVKPVEFDDFVKAVSQMGEYWVLLNQAPR